MNTPEPKPAIKKGDLAQIQNVFEYEIFSVHVLSGLFVVLLNGKIFKKADRRKKEAKTPEAQKYTEIKNLQDTVKHTAVLHGFLYVVTSTALHKIEETSPMAEERENTGHAQTETEAKTGISEGLKISIVLQDDFTKISALDITENEDVIAFGDYEGKIRVKTSEGVYEYTEHEDAIIDIVIMKKTIFSACEDGMLLKTRIGKTEPTDAYEIGKPIRYFGQLSNKLVVLDGYGTPYILSRTENDLKKERKLIRKITDVIKAKNCLYVSHNNEYYRIESPKRASKINVPPMGVDGLFEYHNRIYCYKGQEIRGWKEKEASELEEFFEDL